MIKSKTITVQGVDISLYTHNEEDYICITDMVKNIDGEDHIRNWMRNKNTIEYLGLWESINNSNFKGVEFDTLLNQAGTNRFNLTPQKWINETNAIGIVSKSGKHGGTYAHKDIAYNFGMWLSPAFYLLVVKEYQRLKEDENKQQKSVEWLHRRFLTKANYTGQTDAIKEYILPTLHISKDKEGIIYAQEAELLNVAVFGYTSKEWAERNPEKVFKGDNIRDDATNVQLIALNNAQVLNKELIKAKISQKQRLEIIRSATIDTLKSLSNSPTIKKLEKGNSSNDDFDKGIDKIMGYSVDED